MRMRKRVRVKTLCHGYMPRSSWASLVAPCSCVELSRGSDLRERKGVSTHLKELERNSAHSMSSLKRISGYVQIFVKNEGYPTRILCKNYMILSLELYIVERGREEN